MRRDGPLPPLAIPTTLHDSLLARLDRLTVWCVPDAAVAALAGQLGIRDFIAGARPEDKLSHLHRRQAQGDKVLMLGDGEKITIGTPVYQGDIIETEGEGEAKFESDGTSVDFELKWNDLGKVKDAMASPRVLDARNLLDRSALLRTISDRYLEVQDLPLEKGRGFDGERPVQQNGGDAIRGIDVVALFGQLPAQGVGRPAVPRIPGALVQGEEELAGGDLI